MNNISDSLFEQEYSLSYHGGTSRAVIVDDINPFKPAPLVTSKTYTQEELDVAISKAIKETVEHQEELAKVYQTQTLQALKNSLCATLISYTAKIEEQLTNRHMFEGLYAELHRAKKELEKAHKMLCEFDLKKKGYIR
jgi:erythromycin esterase-like protein